MLLKHLILLQIIHKFSLSPSLSYALKKLINKNFLNNEIFSLIRKFNFL